MCMVPGTIQPPVVAAGSVESGRVVLVGDLPDEFLGDVLDGDDPGQAAVLVHDARQLFAGRAQLLQHRG